MSEEAKKLADQLLEGADSKSLLMEEVYKLGTTQVNLPSAHADFVIKWGREMIKDDDLYYDEKGGNGREIEPHITVLYGITDDEPNEKVLQLIKDTKPFTVRLTSVSLFENEKFDVVKFDVDSDELVNFSNALRQICPNENEYPKYIPHATVAYVKKGKAVDLAGNMPFENDPPIPAEFEVNEILWKAAGDSEDPKRKVLRLQLNRYKKESEGPKDFLKKHAPLPYPKNPDKLALDQFYSALSQELFGTTDTGAITQEQYEQLKAEVERRRRLALGLGEAESPKQAFKKIKEHDWCVYSFYAGVTYYLRMERKWGDWSYTWTTYSEGASVFFDQAAAEHFRDRFFKADDIARDNIKVGKKHVAILDIGEAENPKNIFKKAVNAELPEQVLAELGFEPIKPEPFADATWQRDKDRVRVVVQRAVGAEQVPYYLVQGYFLWTNSKIPPEHYAWNRRWFPQRTGLYQLIEEVDNEVRTAYADVIAAAQERAAGRPRRYEAEDPKRFLRTVSPRDVVTIEWIDQHGQEHSTSYYDIPEIGIEKELQKNLKINKSPYTVAKVIKVSSYMVAEAEDPKSVIKQHKAVMQVPKCAKCGSDILSCTTHDNEKAKKDYYARRRARFGEAENPKDFLMMRQYVGGPRLIMGRWKDGSLDSSWSYVRVYNDELDEFWNWEFVTHLRNATVFNTTEELADALRAVRAQKPTYEFVVVDAIGEGEEPKKILRTARAAHELTPDKIRDAWRRIKAHYQHGTFDDVSLAACSERVDSPHAEEIVNGRPMCRVCGYVDDGTPDPIYHPEYYWHERLEKMMEAEDPKAFLTQRAPVRFWWAFDAANEAWCCSDNVFRKGYVPPEQRMVFNPEEKAYRETLSYWGNVKFTPVVDVSEAKERAPFDHLNFPTDASVLAAKLLDLDADAKSVLI